MEITAAAALSMRAEVWLNSILQSASWRRLTSARHLQFAITRHLTSCLWHAVYPLTNQEAVIRVTLNSDCSVCDVGASFALTPYPRQHSVCHQCWLLAHHLRPAVGHTHSSYQYQSYNSCGTGNYRQRMITTRPGTVDSS